MWHGSDSFPTTNYQAANYWVEPVFTTTNSIPSQPSSPTYPSDAVNLFGTTTPSTTSASDSSTVNVAMRFQVASDGKIYGVRFYKGSGNDGVHVGFLWNYDTVSYLGGVRFDNETSSGWQEAVFSNPINVTAGTNYMISYIAPHGRYAVDSSYFTSDKSNNGIMPWYPVTPGSSNGWYEYDSGIDANTPAFPSNTYNNSNYWVDPIYRAN